MTRKITSIDEIRIDILDAVKRAFISRGYVPRPRSVKQMEKTENSDNQTETESPEAQEVHEKLIDITEKAQDVLCQSNTVFPFTLFPDTITLDREKLTVATRYFFKVAKIVSVPINSISNAEVDVGPFFGSLHISSKFFVQNRYTIRYLSRDMALKLQHLLQGFMIAQEKDIDVTDIDKEDLLILLEDLGQGVPE